MLNRRRHTCRQTTPPGTDIGRERENKQKKININAKGIERDKIGKENGSFLPGTSFPGVACSRLPNVGELVRLPFHSAIREMARGSYYCNMPCDDKKENVHSALPCLLPAAELV